MATRTIETDDLIVTFDDTPELRAIVFERVLKWFEKHQSFQGECIMQSDDPQIYAPVFLSDLADDVFKFKVDLK
jgi:tRNA splicing ligase